LFVRGDDVTLTSPTEAHTLDALSDDQAAALLRDAPWRRFVALGDSVVEGVRGPAPGYRDLSWLDRLVAALRRGRPELIERNLGRRGLFAAEVRRQQLPEALHFGPDLAAVIAGGNDMFRDQFDTAAVEAELDAMVEPLRTGGSDVITMGLFDITRADPSAPTAPMLRKRIRRLAELTGAVAERHGTIHLDFSTHPAGGDPSIYSDDRLHLNARGHAIVAAETIRRLAAVAHERARR
jgi:lysophospholipase L1-like esterase